MQEEVTLVVMVLLELLILVVEVVQEDILIHQIQMVQVKSDKVVEVEVVEV